MTVPDGIQYWEEFYAYRRDPRAPYLFARHIAGDYIDGGRGTLDFGCGDGRGAVFLSRTGVLVLAIDQHAKGIGYLQTA